MSIDLSKFRGTTVALITPFKKDNSLDEAALRKLVDWHIDKGTRVILGCGTTGESATLSHDEHHRVIEILCDQSNGRVPVMANAGSNSTTEAISLTEHATKSGADAILSVGPYYNKPTPEGFYQHFKAVAESTDLPVFLYNVPGRTGKHIDARTQLRLAEIPNIAGTKEASANFTEVMTILRERPDDFLVLSGEDSIALPLLSLGADGAVAVVANEAPGMLSDMVQAAFDNDWKKARELHYNLLPLMRLNFIESNPIPVKAACAMMGLCESYVRLPLVQLSDDHAKPLAAALKELNLI
ncbi:MAG: 4-hydroxy-tetrahydrodipicolinate synthase [candidate division KSB1 bacterium]|nr:4-hydroxy-tetrahydrodipicolinate synthase [candidate division KSB1 bacterium]